MLGMSDYKGKYDNVWLEPSYRVLCHSDKLWRDYRSMFPTPRSAIDIGCGKGQLLRTWGAEGIDCYGVDFSDNCLDVDIRADYGHKFYQADITTLDLGRRFEFGMCCDLMEHIPRLLIPQALKRIAVHCDQICFVIANYPSHYKGVNFHETLEGKDWWAAHLWDIGEVEEMDCVRLGREVYYFMVKTYASS